MGLLIQFESDDWRDYAANLASDTEAWRAANPDLVELGPFDSVTVERGLVIGHLGDEAHELARCGRDEPWRVGGRERLYDRLQVIVRATAMAPLMALIDA